MKRLFLLLALAVPYFLYGEESSISVTDSLVVPSSTDSLEAALDDFIVPADTLPAEVLAGLLAHLDETPLPFGAGTRARSPRRATSTVTLLDSSITVDQSGTPTKKMIYDYDDINRNYKTTTYFYTNGVPNGTSQVQEKVFDGTNTSTVSNTTYQWDATTSQWAGQSRKETVYDDGHHKITEVTYSWSPTYSYWTPTASTTYAYDPANYSHMPEQWTYVIQSSDNKLIPATRTQQEWDASNNLTLKVVYKGGQDANGDWLGGSGGTKNIYAYQTFGTANKKVLDEAYTWNTSLNRWVGKVSGKTTWEYTPNGSYETAKVIFNWNSTTLTYDTASATYKEYDAANHELSSFAYKWTSGVRAGNGTGTRTTYSGNNKDSVYSYTWRNGEWACTKIVVKLVNAANKVIVNETQNYNASGVGSGSGTYTYYASDNSTMTAQTHYTLANSIWTPKDSTAYIYSGSTKIADEAYTWSAALNQWVPKTRKEYLNSTDYITWAYQSSTDTWIVSGSFKRISGTDSEGATYALTYSYNELDSKWQLVSGTRNKLFNDENGASISLAWSITNITDSVWSLASGTKTPVNVTNANGKLLVSSSYYLDVADSTWKVTSYTMYEYNDNNLQTYYASFGVDSVPISYRVDVWNSFNAHVFYEEYQWSGSAYIGYRRSEYTLDADSITLLGQADYYGWNNTCISWKGSSKYLNHYINNAYYNASKPDTSIIYLWNNSTCSWSQYIRHIYIYDANYNELVDITQHGIGYSGFDSSEDLDGDGWVNYTKVEKTYHGSQEVNRVDYTWSASQNDWLTFKINQTTYVAGTNYEKTIITATYNSDGSIATYELTTNYYNTEN